MVAAERMGFAGYTDFAERRAADQHMAENTAAGAVHKRCRFEHYYQMPPGYIQPHLLSAPC